MSNEEILRQAPTPAAPTPRAAILASNLLSPACFFAALLIDLYVYRKGFNWPPIRSDGFGYYLYLPAIFIHHDIFFTFFHDQTFIAQIHGYYSLSEWNWTGLFAQGNGFVDKFPVGTALLQSPFFLAAWAVAKLSSTAPLSGFEIPFQAASCISAAFYFAAAIYILFRILAERTTASSANLCLLFVVTTTNVLLYASYDGSLSHIYSFFLVSALCAVAVTPDNQVWRPLAFGLLLGLAVIVRPTNIIAGLLFIRLAQNADWSRAAGQLALAVLGLVVAASPQAVIWLITSGSPIHYSYGDEGFNFLHPQILNYLFSVRKGVFFWHPAILLMICSLIPHYRKFPVEALLFLMMIMLNLYVGSSWHAWFFGGSFGSRQTVDVLPLMAIATGSTVALLHTAVPSVVAIIRVIVVLLAVVNLAQMYGYMANKIPIDETTWQKYMRFWNPILDR